jgi:hypothetical protein
MKDTVVVAQSFYRIGIGEWVENKAITKLINIYKNYIFNQLPPVGEAGISDVGYSTDMLAPAVVHCLEVRN